MSRRILAFLTPLCLTYIAVLPQVNAENVVENGKDLAKSTKYLALGDSVAFGYTPLAQKPGDLRGYHGYPELVSKGVQLKVANASCFGESSGHFLNLSAPDTGCQAWRSAFPLFADYSGTQMDYAIDYLKQSKKVELVTIDIGINDLGILLQACHGDPGCFSQGLGGTLAVYQANLIAIFRRIRLEANYAGPIVAVTIYANDYSNAAVFGPIAALNAVLVGVAHAFDAEVADAFSAFGLASVSSGGNACTAGLLILLPSGGCNIHPSADGQALIAKKILDLIAKK